MPGWPDIDRVEDRRLAQALREGAADALAQVFDRYATRLYDFCHALLRDQESAADALHDGLIAAQAHVGRLREPELFRGWLYAIVRNECLRRLNDPDRPVERHEAPQAAEVFRTAEEEAHRRNTLMLVHSALSILPGRQREALDLALRHGLDVHELARILGLSVEEAAGLAGQAHGLLDEALVAALIARTGRDECRSVAALIDVGDWPLNAETCGKLIRHIETCPTCSARRPRGVATAELLHALPIALMPVDLGWELLTFATAPDRAEDRAVVAQWAEPFDVSGWPEPWGRHEPPRRARFPRLWPALAAAACVVVVVAVAFVWLPRSSGGSSVGAAPAVPDVSDSATVAPSESAAVDSPEPTPTVSTSSPAAVPTPTPPRPRPRPSTTRPTTKPPTAGTLSISQGSPDLGETGTFLSMTLTAVNGPVTWSASPGPGLSVSGGKRSLAKDESTTVTVTLTRPATCGTDDKGSSSVTFSPGGKTGTVVWTCPPTPSP